MPDFQQTIYRLAPNDKVSFVAPEDGVLFWVPITTLIPGYAHLMDAFMKVCRHEDH